MDGIHRDDVAIVTHFAGVNCVVFSPDGRWVVSGSRDGDVYAWKVDSGFPTAWIKHEGAVLAAAFSPDGSLVVTGGDDGTARVWEVSSGEEVLRITHLASVTSVAFSPNGRWIATGSKDKTVRISAVQPTDLAATLCASLPRNFTQDEWKQFFGDVPYHQTCENLPAGR